MTTIGLAGAGTIGSGLIRLLNTSPAARNLRLKTVLVRDLARPRPGIPAGTPLTARCDELTDDPEIDIVVELLGGVDEAFRVASRALSRGKAGVTATRCGQTARCPSRRQRITSRKLRSGSGCPGG